MKDKTVFGSEINNGGVQPFITTSYPIAYKHTIYLKNVLEHPEEMISAIDMLDNSTDKDVVQIIINCNGGCMSSMDSLLFAMSRCDAHFHGIGSGNIASAATYVLMRCDTFEISPYTQLLFHNASFGYGGEGQDAKEYIDFQYEQTVNFMKGMYSNLFSEEELNDIIYNKRQVYMTAADFIKRWEMFNSEEAVTKVTKDALRKLNKADLIRLICDEIEIDDFGNIRES